MSTPDPKDLDFDNPAHWHGHLRPNPSGMRARCGGLRLGCSVCREEAHRMGMDPDAIQNEDASISGIAPVAAGTATVLRPSFPKTAFGGGEDPADYAPAKRRRAVEDTEFELKALLGL